MPRKKQLIEEVEILDEDQAEENRASIAGKSKPQMMADMMSTMSSMSKSDLIDFFEKSMAQASEAAATIPDGTAEKNAATVAMKQAVQEDLQLIFGDSEDLSEEFKTKTLALFEAAVNSKVAEIKAELEEQLDEKYAETLELALEDVVSKLDTYLDYIAEEWMKENEVAVESSLKVEAADSFIEGLRDLLVSHNYDVPESKLDAVDALTEEVEKLKEAINNVLEENIELNNSLEIISKELVVKELTENLTVAESEKFRVLTENIEYNDVNELVEKLETIKESYFGKKPQGSTQLITEEIEYSSDDKDDNDRPIITEPSIKSYVDVLSRSKK